MVDTIASLTAAVRANAVSVIAAMDAVDLQTTPAQKYTLVRANHNTIGSMATNSQKLVNLAAVERDSRPNLGVFVGNAPADIATFGTIAGRTPLWVLQFCGDANSADYIGAGRYQWLLYATQAPNAKRVWTVNPFLQGGGITQWAAGSYTSLHQSIAAEILKYDTAPDPVYIRCAHEHNGDWYAWSSAGGKHAAYIAGFRSMVAAFRSVAGGNRFKFEWNTNVGGETRMPDPMVAYPGDDVVDILGMDIYASVAYDSSNPVTQWNTTLTRGVGLNWLGAQAIAHKKAVAITEWGVEFTNYGPFIQSMADWINAHDTAYHNYWFSNSGVAAKTGLTGATATAFNLAFK